MSDISTKRLPDYGREFVCERCVHSFSYPPCLVISFFPPSDSGGMRDRPTLDYPRLVGTGSVYSWCSRFTQQEPRDDDDFDPIGF